jgi:hypothetical protein
MCQGRCAGCGKTGPDKAVAAHTVRCPQFAARFRAGTALDPRPEYARWKNEEADAEKAAARQAQVGRTDDARAAMAERFRTRDPLED